MDHFKKWLKEHVIRKDGIYNNRCSEQKWWNKFPKEYNDIMENTKHFNSSTQIKERIYAILNNITIPPKCKSCGNNVKLHKTTYSQYCSLKCAAINQETKNKRKITTMEKYGVEYITQSSDIQEKIVNTCKKKYNRTSKNNIHISDNSMQSLQDKVWLYDMHITNKKTLVEIAEYLNNLNKDNIYYGTIKTYLEYHDIPFQINKTGTSLPEKELAKFLDIHGIQYIMNYRPIKNKELDIYIPSFNLGIEFNGLYWHSFSRTETAKERNRHLNKSLYYKDIGIDVLHIFENEWENKKDIWKSILLNKFGKSKRIYARKCIIKQISTQESKIFFDDNHLQGFIGGTLYFGLFYEDILVCAASFSKARYNKNAEWELLRFANKINHSIVGGAERLLNNFIKEYSPKNIISYSDKRFSNGNLYKKLGFEFIKQSDPNYFYWDKSILPMKLQSRIKFQKHKLLKILDNFDENLTESENMFNNNYRRIWDCGNDVWILNL